MGHRLLCYLYRSGSMVHCVRRNGLTLKKKRFISVIILLATFGMTMMGCHSIVQPSRRRLTEMNSFQEGCYRLDISVDMIDTDFAMQYDSAVEAAGEKSVWDGTANVYYMGAYFTQDCLTYYDSGLSCKQWRSEWVASDTRSILEQIRKWQQLSAEGKGYYQKKPEAIAAFHEDLADLETEVYTVTLQDVDVDWDSICDADLDSAFGGNDRLEAVSQMNVTLLYGTEDLQLKAVLLAYEEEEVWVSACVAVSQIESISEFDMDTLSIQEGYLSEEWTLYSWEQGE